MHHALPPETRSDQIDGTANLTCKDGTCQHAIDGHEPTHNRSVAGSSASRPMRWAVDPSGRPALVSLRRCAARRPVGCPRNDPWPRSFYRGVCAFGSTEAPGGGDGPADRTDPACQWRLGTGAARGLGRTTTSRSAARRSATLVASGMGARCGRLLARRCRGERHTGGATSPHRDGNLDRDVVGAHADRHDGAADYHVGAADNGVDDGADDDPAAEAGHDYHPPAPTIHHPAASAELPPVLPGLLYPTTATRPGLRRYRRRGLHCPRVRPAPIRCRQRRSGLRKLDRPTAREPGAAPFPGWCPGEGYAPAIS